MKTGRHARILDIIAEHPIETQDELLTRLREEGFKATQATIQEISRIYALLKLSEVTENIAMFLHLAVQPISVPIFQIFSALR